ncbi:DUF3099 domain-containing protein [Microbacterium sp.]|uniref:DUF3099 domain-containing protein n=1 Tax=Microbacterium sp. TaxID=51671 RepID=UPI002E36C813|nr:DUF3099 domain-containing protein [Microbacterium sp.]HEX5729813.1 DUF3099 domain-containing protein [Microbacterium sp.]
MKSSSRPQSATSLPRAPRDDEARRSSRYLVMMGIRIACFILMVVITPYGWYTWVLGAAAIVLPYFAVVLANVSANVRRTDAENPERALPAAPSVQNPPASSGPVLRIEETRAIDQRSNESDGHA